MLVTTFLLSKKVQIHFCISGHKHDRDKIIIPKESSQCGKFKTSKKWFSPKYQLRLFCFRPSI